MYSLSASSCRTERSCCWVYRGIPRVIRTGPRPRNRQSTAMRMEGRREHSTRRADHVAQTRVFSTWTFASRAAPCLSWGGGWRVQRFPDAAHRGDIEIDERTGPIEMARGDRLREQTQPIGGFVGRSQIPDARRPVCSAPEGFLATENRTDEEPQPPPCPTRARACARRDQRGARGVL